MSEINRIIQEGVLSREFFRPEIINDFQVDEKRKKIWAIGVDLLLKFDAVCRKHNLKYSLAFGSLLGIIRHRGFIPWDDDIDVFMPREDYEKLKEYRSEFNNPYFLQFPGYDNGYAFSFAKLRNINTTGISWAFRYETFNQGLYLDIFPLDNCPSERIEDDIMCLKKLIDEGSAAMRRSCPFPDENDLAKLSRFPIQRDYKDIVRDTDVLLRRYNTIHSDNYIAWSILTYDYHRLIYKKEFFDDLIEMDFYGHPVYVPRLYDIVLSTTYGNYMEMPPIENRGVWHSSNIFDPEIPYKDYQSLLLTNERKKV